jgi:hypothetical protein
MSERTYADVDELRSRKRPSDVTSWLGLRADSIVVYIGAIPDGSNYKFIGCKIPIEEDLSEWCLPALSDPARRGSTDSLCRVAGYNDRSGLDRLVPYHKFEYDSIQYTLIASRDGFSPKSTEQFMFAKPLSLDDFKTKRDKIVLAEVTKDAVMQEWRDVRGTVSWLDMLQLSNKNAIILYILDDDKRYIHLVHHGNIMEVMEDSRHITDLKFYAKAVCSEHKDYPKKNTEIGVLSFECHAPSDTANLQYTNTLSTPSGLMNRKGRLITPDVFVRETK